jgi:hypothetical protein
MYYELSSSLLNSFLSVPSLIPLTMPTPLLLVPSSHLRLLFNPLTPSLKLSILILPFSFPSPSLTPTPSPYSSFSPGPLLSECWPDLEQEPKTLPPKYRKHHPAKWPHVVRREEGGRGGGYLMGIKSEQRIYCATYLDQAEIHS